MLSCTPCFVRVKVFCFLLFLALCVKVFVVRIAGLSCCGVRFCFVIVSVLILFLFCFGFVCMPLLYVFCSVVMYALFCV